MPAANDGASGVGVLLEVARQLNLQDSIKTPVDIVFFDCEDIGTPAFYTGQQRENTWCLGSQVFAAHYRRQPYVRYQFGIVLDMVGDATATFPKEYYSTQYAGNYQQKIWRAAAKLGHGRYFVDKTGVPLIDDHFYLNYTAGIPTVDIIHCSATSDTGFAPWWHTREDNMTNIDKTTLQAVGEVVLECTK